MTNPTMALAELAEKGADIDVLRQMVQFMAQRLMELDVDGRCGAGLAVDRPRHGAGDWRRTAALRRAPMAASAPGRDDAVIALEPKALR